MSTKIHSEPKRQLGLFDAVSIVMGIVIGAGIFESASLIAKGLPNPVWLFGVWLAGGFIALMGALCYAELGTSFPKEGGEYQFLRLAYGEQIGTFYAWCEFWIIRPGSVGAMAYVFARYADRLVPLPLSTHSSAVWAAVAIGTLSIINLLGVRSGKWTQNTLTVIKVAGLVAIFVVAFGLGKESSEVVSPTTSEYGWSGLQRSMILVMFTYGGWNDMSLVAAEVRRPERNILWALVLGTSGITIVYILVNLAFLHSLGFASMQNSAAIATELFPKNGFAWGAKAISLLICISCLGAINGMVMTGSRVYYALGTRNRFFAWLGQWSARHDAPVRSLVLQAVVTLAIVLLLGRDADSFARIVIFTAPPFFLFFTLNGIAVVVLRCRKPETARPFRVPLYPLPVILFVGSSLFMLWSSLTWAWKNGSYEVLWSIGIAAVGLPFVLLSRPNKDGPIID